MFLCVVVSIRDSVETLQHIIGKVLLILPFRQLDDGSGIFTCFLIDTDQTKLVLYPLLSTPLASLGALGAMDPFDDPNDVLMVS